MLQVKGEAGLGSNPESAQPAIEEDPDSFALEYPAILAIIKMANVMDSLLHPSFIEARYRFPVEYIDKLSKQYCDLIHTAGVPEMGRELSSYLETYFDRNERINFSLIGKRCLMWYFNLRGVIQKIHHFASDSQLRSPHGVLVLTHVINVYLAEAPILFFRPPMQEFKNCILFALDKVVKQHIVYSPLEIPALRISIAQIIARAARLFWSNIELYSIAALVESKHISFDDVNDIALHVRQNLPADLQNNPDLMIGGSYSVIDAQQTGVDKGYSTLMQCSLMYPVLYTIPLLKEVQVDFSPAHIEEYIYLEHNIDDYALRKSNTEKLFAKYKWEEKKRNLNDVLEGLSHNVELLISTLENKLLAPMSSNEGRSDSTARDPRRIRNRAELSKPETNALASSVVNDDDEEVERPHRKKKTMTLEDRMDLAIQDAMHDGDFSRIMGLLDQGVRPDFARQSTGETIMIAAAATGSLADIRQLHKRGCSVLAKDRSGRDPAAVAKERNRENEILVSLRNFVLREREAKNSAKQG